MLVHMMIKLQQHAPVVVFLQEQQAYDLKVLIFTNCQLQDKSKEDWPTTATLHSKEDRSTGVVVPVVDAMILVDGDVIVCFDLHLVCGLIHHGYGPNRHDLCCCFNCCGWDDEKMNHYSCLVEQLERWSCQR